MLSDVVQNKRRKILDAALDVFSRKGFHNATISEVAKQAHIGKGTVYLYFEGKESLLVAIFEELADHVVRLFDHVSLEGGPLNDVVRRMVSKDVESGRTKKQTFQLLAQQPFLATLSLQKEKRSLIERVIGKVAARIRGAVDGGVLRPCDATLAACVLLSLPGAVSLYGAASPMSDLPGALPHVAEELAAVLWRGLGKEEE